jgi:hypothetical protein
MKKPRTLTRIAASVLMIPVLYIAATGLLYGIFAVLCSDLVSANWLFALAEIIYVILICMTPVLPIVVVGSSAVGIPLQIRGIRKGEDKKKGLCIVAAFVLLIVLLTVSCLALVHYMNTTGGFRS